MFLNLAEFDLFQKKERGSQRVKHLVLTRIRLLGGELLVALAVLTAAGSLLPFHLRKRKENCPEKMGLKELKLLLSLKKSKNQL
jgi:hypothetical protein